MPTEYNHGVRVIRATDGAITLAVISTSVIGLVSTSADADVEYFPTGERVLITDIKAAIAKAGVGLLKTVLEAIKAQTTPVIVAVRAAIGEDAEDTEANVLAALDALLAAEGEFDVQPRIIGAPGLETQVVAAKVAEVTEKLSGFCYTGCSLEIDGPDFVTDLLAYRDEFDSREQMLLYPDWKSGTTVWPAAAVALGQRAAIDITEGWNKTISNVAVKGVTGVTVPVSREQAKVLNEAGVTVCLRRKGYKFWGQRTCSENPQYLFESDTRTDQVLADTIEEGCEPFVDKSIRPSLIRDVLESVNALFRRLTRGGYILGAEARYLPENNPTDQLQGGKLAIEYEFTATPPLEDLAFTARKTSTYLASLTSAA